MLFESNLCTFRKIVSNGKRRYPVAVFRPVNREYLNDAGEIKTIEDTRLKVTLLQDRFNKLALQGIMPTETRAAIKAFESFEP